MKEKVDFKKKTWIKPQISSIPFKDTKGGFIHDEQASDDATYTPS